MTKKYSIKKALLSTIVALFLSFAMLIGTTFAWFTDSVTSNGNKIVAGNLKVDLKLLEEDGSWTSIKDTGKAIFDYDNWEPGYTEVEILKVANEGSLSLKWQAKIVAENALTSLASVIDVYVKMGATEKPQNRAELSTWDYAGTLNTFVDTMAETIKGELKASESAYFGVAFMMQQTAGDEYQGANLGGTFNVVVTATQLAYESDSFGDDYDANLEMGSDNGLSRTLNDGSTAFYYNEESGYAGRVRLTKLPENLGNEYAVPAEVNDLGGALYGVNLDKLTIPAGVENAYKSLEKATIDEVVIEDGATKIADRMFYRAKVGSVVIPDGVTVIEQNAFAQAEIVENLVIPASVTTVEEAAFQHMTHLKTVTFEGNTAIQGYAFRGCKALRTVYLNGDDVTFIPSTLNGRNSTWFCNGESNNPGVSNITFHVQNETVALRVKTAMGAEAGNTPVYIGETLYATVKNVTELQNAFNSNCGAIINFTANIKGDATITQKANADVVINGNGYTYEGVLSVFGGARQYEAETLTIKNINFKAGVGADSCIYSPDRALNNSYSYSHNVTVENCTFTDANGGLDCAAIRHGDGGDNNWLVKGCTVDNTMHSLLQVNNVVGDGITIENCVVKSKNGINMSQCVKVNVIGCEFDVTGYAIRFGANSGTVGAVETYLIKDCTLKSACDGGDAVIILRATSDNSTLTIENTTIVGTTEITNKATNVTIIR